MKDFMLWLWADKFIFWVTVLVVLVIGGILGVALPISIGEVNEQNAACHSVGGISVKGVCFRKDAVIRLNP